MAAAGITKRWVRGSLLITVLVILAAEVMFLYTDYRELYGGVQRAAESRFFHHCGPLAGHRHGGRRQRDLREPRPGPAPHRRAVRRKGQV